MSHSTLIPHFLEPTLSKAKTDEGTTTQGGRGGRLEVEKEVAELMPEAQMEGLTVVETVPPPPMGQRRHPLSPCMSPRSKDE